MKTVFFKTCALLAALSLPTFSESADGIRNFSFPECEIICIRDAAMKMPRSLFRDTAEPPSRPREEFYESSVNVFLIRTAERVMLVDAGNAPERGSLRQKLRDAGVRPEEISDIFITHIHPDHVGGLLREGKAFFANATIHIAREELEAWQTDTSRRALAEYLSPYEGRIHAFEYGETLPGGLLPVKRSGHTPGHTIFRMPLRERTEAVFAGDVVHAAALQFPFPTFCAGYDAVPAEAAASRILTLKMDGLLFGAHFPFPGVALGGAVSSGAPEPSFVYREYNGSADGMK